MKTNRRFFYFSAVALLLIILFSCSKDKERTTDRFLLKASVADTRTKTYLVSSTDDMVSMYGERGFNIWLFKVTNGITDVESDDYVAVQDGPMMLNGDVAKYYGDGLWTVDHKVNWPALGPEDMYVAISAAPSGIMQCSADNDGQPVFTMCLPHIYSSLSDVLASMWVSTSTDMPNFEFEHIMCSFSFRVKNIEDGWRVSSVRIFGLPDYFEMALASEARYRAYTDNPFDMTVVEGTDFGGSTGKELQDLNFMAFSGSFGSLLSDARVEFVTTNGTETKTCIAPIRGKLLDGLDVDGGVHTTFNINFVEGNFLTVEIESMDSWSVQDMDLGLVTSQN